MYRERTPREWIAKSSPGVALEALIMIKPSRTLTKRGGTPAQL
jgi:hypothetical protein